MANILVDEQAIMDIADAIREKNETETKYKPREMAAAIRDIMTTAKSFILEMPDGTEIPAVLVDHETVFTATPNDIREGKVAATGDGVTIGEKIIPSYHTSEFARYIPVGSKFEIPLPNLDLYDYTKLQVIICRFDTSIKDSVLSEKVAMLDKVYNVGSNDALATVIKDANTKSIDLGIINDSDHPCVIRIFTYKEIS